jgi:hypothetical protein
VLAWPPTREELIEEQLRLAALAPATWQTAADVSLSAARARTPEPLRRARRRARQARALGNSDDWRQGRERWQT